MDNNRNKVHFHVLVALFLKMNLIKILHAKEEGEMLGVNNINMVYSVVLQAFFGILE